jgi:uncharacterized 2Fe-2S/4Fe-4S cluster protein (DUF4445 family)
MPRVTFLPAGVTAECAEGESVFEVAERAGVVVETACVAAGTCGLCRVKVVAGDACLVPYGDVDRKHLGNVYFITKVRLSCQARLRADGEVTVEVPAAARKPR